MTAAAETTAVPTDPREVYAHPLYAANPARLLAQMYTELGRDRADEVWRLACIEEQRALNVARQNARTRAAVKCLPPCRTGCTCHGRKP